MNGHPVKLKENVEIKPHTTFGIGGVARYFIEIKSVEELPEAIELAKKKKAPHYVIAGGSNLVFGDGLLYITLIKLCPPKTGKLIEVRGNKITCDASVVLMDLVNSAVKNSLGGMETLSGIPGTVGGAIVGNAGAYGQAIPDKLEKVLVFDGQKKKWLTKKECKFVYRGSIFSHPSEREGSAVAFSAHGKRGGFATKVTSNPSLYVLRAVFKLDKGDKKALEKKSREIIEIRDKKYPPGLKTPGSFFKNVLINEMPRESLKFLPTDRDYFGKVPAWHFLNQVGARGMREGGIAIADFHGNYLINTGSATFEDVKTLADKLKKLVKDKFGVELEEEVVYVAE
ncbi:MAG: UDP-N-acetylmuramate dehydrogenase [Candidatus Vogelbacteria bacterium]|nr:UDP-N-acetylmuramate dehydrogenase [Candidatus Vogelbacteria bacterium]